MSSEHGSEHDGSEHGNEPGGERGGESGRGGFSAFVVSRPVSVAMITAALVVFGVISYGRLRLALLPDLSYPTLTVRTGFPGASPHEVESEVSRKLEERLSTLTGLIGITSVSRAERGDVILDFAWGTDIDLALQQVTEKLDQEQLAEGIERPLILRYDPSLEPVLRIGLSASDGAGDGAGAGAGDGAGVSEASLREYAENELKRELESVEGVASAHPRGGVEREVRVEVSEAKLTIHGLNILDVAQRLRAENLNAPGGRIKDGKTDYLVRTVNAFESVEALAAVQVARSGDATVRLRDVAEVKVGEKDRTTVTRINGKPGVVVEVFREADANIVQVARRVKDKLFGNAELKAKAAKAAREAREKAASEKAERGKAESEKAESEKGDEKGDENSGETGGEKSDGKKVKRGGRGRTAGVPVVVKSVSERLPAGVQLQLLNDQASFIEKSIDEVTATAWQGALLAVFVMYLFLRRLGPTLVLAVSIPLSVVVTFVPMLIGNVSLNLMTLGGLALGIGMLVDNSIVVLESIIRCREEGDDLMRSAMRGTAEVAGAVTASTLTTLAVFLPIVFVEGVAGQVFSDLALTIVFSLAASLLVALTVVPVLAARLGVSGGEGAGGAALGGVGGAGEGGGSGAGGGVRGRFVAMIEAMGVVKSASFFASYRGAVAGYFARLREGSGAVKGLLGLVLPLAMVWLLAVLIVSALGSLLARVVGVVVALLVALGAAVFFGVSAAIDATLGRVAGVFVAGFDRVSAGYAFGLCRLLAAPWAVVALAVLLVLSSGYAAERVAVALLPDVSRGEARVRLTFAVGTPLEETMRLAGAFERAVLERFEGARVMLAAGVEETDENLEDKGPNIAELVVVLPPPGEGVALARYEAEAFATLRALAGRQAGASVRVSRPEIFSFKPPLSIEVRGHDLAKLKAVSERVVEILREVPGVSDVRSTARAGFPEFQIAYDRERLAAMNLDASNVAAMARAKLLGETAGQFPWKDQRIDIRVVNRDEDRASLAELKRLTVNPRGVNAAPLSAVATVTASEGPAEIRRLNQERAAVVEASLTGLDLGGVIGRIEARLAGESWPDDVVVSVGGQREEMEASLASLQMAFLLALFLVYVVMASQFESVREPLIIMAAVPFSAVGVFWALYLLQVPVSIVVVIGVIVLAGVVVNNAIVLVDYANTLFLRGMAWREAVILSARVRLRPILITTLTTVLGLIPMALSQSEGAEVRAPMAVTIIAGLATSTLLTLVLLPALLLLAGGGRRRDGAVAGQGALVGQGAEVTS